jgi:transcriptional regulator with XRE-family HTH domain
VRVVDWHEGDLVHKLRGIYKLTVQQLSKRADVAPSVIYRLEDGRTKEPKRETVSKLAAAFGMTPREFEDAVPPVALRLREQTVSAKRG